MRLHLGDNSNNNILFSLHSNMSAAPAPPPRPGPGPPPLPLTCVVIGCGNRGAIYSNHFDVVAIAEPSSARRNMFLQKYGRTLKVCACTAPLTHLVYPQFRPLTFCRSYYISFFTIPLLQIPFPSRFPGPSFHVPYTSYSIFPCSLYFVFLLHINVYYSSVLTQWQSHRRARQLLYLHTYYIYMCV